MTPSSNRQDLENRLETLKKIVQYNSLHNNNLRIKTGGIDEELLTENDELVEKIIELCILLEKSKDMRIIG